jgi:hypothetical protein
MRPPFLFAALSAVLLSSCYSPGDGVAPPLNEIYFPTGLALDVIPTMSTMAPAAPAHLFIASSDFDLQYRASALASFDLNVLHDHYLPQLCNTDADCDTQHCDNGEATNPAQDSGNREVTPSASYFCFDPAVNVEPNGLLQPCLPLAQQSTADQVLYPGHCAAIDPRIVVDGHNLITTSVQIGAFATDAVFRVPGPDADGNPVMGGGTLPDGRLFIPVRGDATLHWIDTYDDGHLDCGQSDSPDGSCDDAHRVGDDEVEESQNSLRQEPEPFAIAIDDAGQNVAITNQTTGSVSLYVNHWVDGPSVRPDLVYLLTGLPTAPVGIAALPTPRLIDPTSYEPGFLAVYADAPQVDLLRVHVEGKPVNPPQDSAMAPLSYAVRTLTRAGSASINANSIGSDSRGIAIDDSERKADYVACAPACDPTSPKWLGCVCPGATPGAPLTPCTQALQTCLQSAHQPSVYVSNRAPASVLIGTLASDKTYISGTSELPEFSDSLPLTQGPSRVVLGKVRVPGTTYPDSHGAFALEQRVFIVCFDSRRIYIYDPVRQVVDAIVTTGRGPFALAIDEQRGLGYVAHFTDSYLGVISLDQRFPNNYAQIIASVGIPTPPRASK